MALISPTEAQLFAALRSFLLSVVPSGTAKYNGSIAGNVLTVASMLPNSGQILLGDQVLGAGVAAGAFVSAFGTGTGGVGTYTIGGASQTVQTTVMASGVEVVRQQVNRVPPPPVADYVEMQSVVWRRLSTNLDEAADVSFDASIAGTVMTVTEILVVGEIQVGATVWGDGVAAPTVVLGVGTGTGGTGTYYVAPSQAVAGAEMAAGTKEVTESFEVTFQMDFYGPNSADFSRSASALLRDDYGVQFFSAALQAMSPLHADEASQMAFPDGEQQYETRWKVDARFQVDQTYSVPQQYADELSVTTLDVPAQLPT